MATRKARTLAATPTEPRASEQTARAQAAKRAKLPAAPTEPRASKQTARAQAAKRAKLPALVPAAKPVKSRTTAKTRRLPAARPPKLPAAKRAATEHDVTDVVNELTRLASKKTKDGMARYGIPSERAFGVPVGVMRTLAKRLGKSHALAEALWKSGHYEARMLAAFVDDPALVTRQQMERWCQDFDNWAICDTACFALFDRTPYGFEKVHAWAKSEKEFVKRAAFALLASLTVHDKTAKEEDFLASLALIERAAHDPRHFVKKAVNWSLRSIGKKSPALHRAALEVAERLAALPDAAPRWVGKDALRELRGASVQRRLAKASR
jgi:3-methyladenine DNA glycosylase AlkD